MKIKFILYFFYCLLTIFCLTSCKTTPRENYHMALQEWKFKIDDSLVFAHPAYDDKHWKILKIDTLVNEHGISPYYKYCWYRKSILIPSNLRQHNNVDDSLKFYLGKTGEYNQLFLNGHLISENGKMVKENSAPLDTLTCDNSAKNEERIFYLSCNDPRILWDQVNTIAIRSFYFRLKSDAAYISLKGMEDNIQYNKDKFYVPGNTGSMDTVLIIKNTSANMAIAGAIVIGAENMSTKENIYSKKQDIMLNPGATTSVPISLPVTTEQTKINFQFTSTGNTLARDSMIIPFVLIK
jgi:hypothetical protein